MCKDEVIWSAIKLMCPTFFKFVVWWKYCNHRGVLVSGKKTRCKAADRWIGSTILWNDKKIPDIKSLFVTNQIVNELQKIQDEILWIPMIDLL